MAVPCGKRAHLGRDVPCYQAASAVTPTPADGHTAASRRGEPHPARPPAHQARPAWRWPSGRSQSRRGVAAGPRGCQAVPRAGAKRLKARQVFVSNEIQTRDIEITQRRHQDAGSWLGKTIDRTCVPVYNGTIWMAWRLRLPSSAKDAHPCRGASFLFFSTLSPQSRAHHVPQKRHLSPPQAAPF